ncbi:MAG: LAGLIDADG family homing endonuclease [Patescibacteria group bacterium]
MDKLPGDYIAGFVDGEGCFALKFRRDIRHERKNVPIYFYWDVEFVILLRFDDEELLKQIRQALDCGKISISKRGGARYAVNDINDLTKKIVPFFNQYKLFGKKRFDLELWKESVDIINRNQRKKINTEKGKNGFQKTIWNDNDLERLKSIHEEMIKYKSKGHEWKWLKKTAK